MIPAVWAALVLAPVAAGSVVDAARFGARPGADGATNTKAIQEALDAAGSAGGGTAAVTRPGVYDLAAQGANPYQSGHRYCLLLRHDGLTFRIGRGVTLRLADAQQSDATGPVDVIVWQSRKGLRIAGGGTVSGNTAGQRGWTGRYSQVTNGTLLAGYGDGLKPNDGITVEDLTLVDHFSNALTLSGHPDSRDRTIKVLGVRARDTGEGPLIMNADEVVVRDVTYENRAVDPHPGDGLELWNVTDFEVARVTVRGLLGGSGIDLHGARRGTVEGFTIEDVRDGIEISENTSLRTYSERVEVRNGTIALGHAGTGVITKGVRVRDVTLKAVRVTGRGVSGSIGFGISSSNAGVKHGDDWRQEGPVKLVGCEAHNLDIGLLIKTVANLSVLGGDYSDNKATPHSDGILWMGQGNAWSNADTRGLHMDGVKATGNRRFGLHFDAQGIRGREPDGHLAACSLAGNGVEGYHITKDADQEFVRDLWVDTPCFMASLAWTATPPPSQGSGNKPVPPPTELGKKAAPPSQGSGNKPAPPPAGSAKKPAPPSPDSGKKPTPPSPRP